MAAGRAKTAGGPDTILKRVGHEGFTQQSVFSLVQVEKGTRGWEFLMNPFYGDESLLVWWNNAVSTGPQKLRNHIKSYSEHIKNFSLRFKV